MCGIAGIISDRHNRDALRRAPGVLASLRHRGPDDEGFLALESDKLARSHRWDPAFADADVLLMHTRLSIIDLSSGGWQPMSTPDGRYHITFNGEIYNYRELRDELQRAGHRFSTASDTEVLLHAWAEWDVGALTRLVGMFAFALLDVHARKLTLARDYFGIKPLFVTRAGPLAFSSELKSLLEFGLTSRAVNPEVAYLCLRFGLCDSGTGTMFRDVEQLPPAHYMEISIDHPSRRRTARFWEPATTPLQVSLDEAAAKLRELFLESVDLHLRSDVPIGAALSGGIDSSAIVMAIREVNPAAELSTFSFIAEEGSISEERWVDIVAARSGSAVHKIHATAAELVRDLDELTFVQDQPIAGSSPYAQYRVFRRAGEAGIKVMIDGQGADEMLGGYRYYIAARLATLVRQGRWRESLALLQSASRLPGGPGMLWMAMRTAGYLFPPRFHPMLRRLAGRDMMPSWLDSQWFRTRGVREHSLEPHATTDVLQSTLRHDLTTLSIPQLLRYEDRNSMAFSIESRVPFLTPALAEFIGSLPEEYLISDDGTSKYVFRRAMRGLVPDEILARRDKIGFATPEKRWLQTVQPWVERVLQSDVAGSVYPLNRGALQREWQRVISGRVPFHSQLWRALNLVRWSELYRAEYE